MATYWFTEPEVDFVSIGNVHIKEGSAYLWPDDAVLGQPVTAPMVPNARRSDHFLATVHGPFLT